MLRYNNVPQKGLKIFVCFGLVRFSDSEDKKLSSLAISNNKRNPTKNLKGNCEGQVTVGVREFTL